MKNIFSLLFLATIVLFSACKDDDMDGHNDTNPEYKITINSPNSEDKKVGDSFHIHVDFESETSETVHHVNVRIYNKADNTEIYNKPSGAHVHETSGKYEHHDDFDLTTDNGLEGHTDWILEAKVWGHEAGVAEVMQTMEFHVHPE